MNTDFGRCNCYSGKFDSNGKDTYSASLYETVSRAWIRKDGIAKIGRASCRERV